MREKEKTDAFKVLFC